MGMRGGFVRRGEGRGGVLRMIRWVLERSGWSFETVS